MFNTFFPDNRAFFCWKTKATDTHSEYVLLIVCPRQMWLHTKATQWYVRRTLPVLLFYKIYFLFFLPHIDRFQPYLEKLIFNN
jgi:hypothetical protein